MRAVRIVSRVSDLIGETPFFDLPLRLPHWRLLLKLEKFNPGQSMKDRMARSMIEEAERSGRLRKGGTIVESSSGNTGIGLALLAAERGYRFLAVVDHHASRDKVRVMRAYGAEIVEVEGAFAEDEVATAARESLADRLGASIPGAVFLAQADNPANPLGYYGTLAHEILAAAGDLDVLVGAVGTGGSLCGSARRIKEQRPAVRVVGVEPVGSIIFGGEAGCYYQSGTGTPAGVEVAGNVDYSLIDERCKVSDAAAFTTARHLARRFGLLVGGAAGGVIHSALRRLAEHPEGGTAVAITADGGERYLDTVFDDAWMEKRQLFDATVEHWLREILPERD